MAYQREDANHIGYSLWAHQLFPVLMYHRIVNQPHPPDGHGDEDHLLDSLIDVACFNDEWEKEARAVFFALSEVLVRLVRSWLESQSEETLQDRQAAVVARLQSEQPREKEMQGFDYAGQYLKALKAFARFEPTWLVRTMPDFRNDSEKRVVLRSLMASSHLSRSDLNTLVDADMQKNLDSWREWQRVGIDPGDLSRAEEVPKVLADGYRRDGIGLGVSMDDLVQGCLDLTTLGHDDTVAYCVTMRAVQGRLENIVAEQALGGDPLHDEDRRLSIIRFLEWLGWSGPGIDTGDLYRARSIQKLLAAGYCRQGIGAGVSLDRFVHASLSLQCLGYGEVICCCVAMEGVMDLLRNLIRNWQSTTGPGHKELRRRRAELYIDMGGRRTDIEPGEDPPLLV